MHFIKSKGNKCSKHHLTTHYLRLSPVRLRSFIPSLSVRSPHRSSEYGVTTPLFLDIYDVTLAAGKQTSSGHLHPEIIDATVCGLLPSETWLLRLPRTPLSALPSTRCTQTLAVRDPSLPEKRVDVLGTKWRVRSLPADSQGAQDESCRLSAIRPRNAGLDCRGNCQESKGSDSCHRNPQKSKSAFLASASIPT